MTTAQAKQQTSPENLKQCEEADTDNKTGNNSHMNIKKKNKIRG